VIFLSNAENWYYNGCKYTFSHFSWLIQDIAGFRRRSEKAVSEEYRNSIIYTGFDLEPYETAFFSYFVAGSMLILILAIDFIIFRLISFESATIKITIALSLLIPIIALVYLSEYIKIYARWMKVSSLGDMPEILSYMVMSMKIVPNMEVAIRFAAEHSTRPLAKDLRKMLWNLHVREYKGMEDAMIGFAEIWGRNSEYFKRSLHLVKSSTSEPDEAQRIITLNRALDIVLESTKRLMETFASKLKNPTYILYSVFILIPLALVALMPAITVVGIRFGIGTLVALYNIILPLLTFGYAEYILLQRPATFVPQSIPDSHPELRHIRKKKTLAMVISICMGVLIASSGYLWNLIGNPGNIISTATLEGILPSGLLVILGFVFAVSFYLNTSYMPYKKIRDEIRRMESEFSDALFVLGRRISEGSATEEAFMHAASTMQGSEIATAFERISLNLISVRADILTAIFDDEIGAFRDIYSDRIRTTMMLFVESAHKSHEAAGVAVVKLADHLKELQDVELNIKQSLYDMTSTMRSTAAIFAPLIAGVTMALSEVITKILQNISNSISRLPADMIPGSAQISPANLEQSIPSDLFMLSIGVYLILITVILTRFAGTIEYGGDRDRLMYDLGQVLPISAIVFTLSTVVSRIIFRGLV
jgi:Flp pilus assembly protein TadB